MLAMGGGGAIGLIHNDPFKETMLPFCLGQSDSTSL